MIAEKNERAKRIATFSQLYGQELTKIDITEGERLELQFTDHSLLTIATDDVCSGTRRVVADPLVLELRNTAFLDCSIHYLAGEISKRERIDLVRLMIETGEGVALVDLVNIHTRPDCQRWRIWWRLSRSGTNGIAEGEWR